MENLFRKRWEFVLDSGLPGNRGKNKHFFFVFEEDDVLT